MAVVFLLSQSLNAIFPLSLNRFLGRQAPTEHHDGEAPLQVGSVAKLLLRALVLSNGSLEEI